MTTVTELRPRLAVNTVMDTTKRDMTLSYAGRTVVVRAYRDGSDPHGAVWHAVIIENRTPLRHGQGPSPTPEGCFADAVRFLVADAEARTSVATASA